MALSHYCLPAAAFAQVKDEGTEADLVAVDFYRWEPDGAGAGWGGGREGADSGGPAPPRMSHSPPHPPLSLCPTPTLLSARLPQPLPAHHRPGLRALCRGPGRPGLQAQPPALVPHRPGRQRHRLPALHGGGPALRGAGRE